MMEQVPKNRIQFEQFLSGRVYAINSMGSSGVGLPLLFFHSIPRSLGWTGQGSHEQLERCGLLGVLS